MDSEFYLTFEVYLQGGICVYHLQIISGLFYKFIDELKSFPGVEVDLRTTWECTVENGGIKYAKIRNSYFVKDVTGSDFEIAYRFSYMKLDEDEDIEV